MIIPLRDLGVYWIYVDEYVANLMTNPNFHLQ